MKTISLFVILLIAILVIPACQNNPVTAPETPESTPTAKPATPSDAFIVIDSTIANDKRVVISWKSNSTDEEGFYLSSGNRKFDWVRIATAPVGTTSFTMSLKEAYHAGNALSFLVSAFNSIGESNVAISNEIVIK
jgi:ABC-type Fe3+-hydroxamate transport system substrate-binding protein